MGYLGNSPGETFWLAGDYTLGMTAPRRTLVIGDGGISSILACSAAADAALLAEPDPARRRQIRPVLWVGALQGPTATARRWVSRRQAELFDLELVEEPEGAPSSLAATVVGGEWPGDTLNLVKASVAAIERGCSSVVWPTHSSHAQAPELDEVSRAVDRALLVGRLIALDADQHGCPGFHIETPTVDLSDRQIADLVLDMDLPVRLCWWWHAEMGRDGVAEFRREHERWVTVLREVGWRGAGDAPIQQVGQSGAGGAKA